MPEIIVKLGDNIVHRYYFDKDVISVGRARDNDIVIENLAVSRNHARIRRENNHFILTDLNSANGTFVNGVRVTKTEVMNDDVITIGKHYLHFINKEMSDEQIISDAFGAERTMIVEKVANAVLTIVKGKQQGEKFNITKYETFIGRASDNDIRLHDWFVSKKHAVIVRQGQKFFIRDLGSWRGTTVNGKQIKDTELHDGDMLGFGTTQIEFRMQREETPLLEGRRPVELIGEEVLEAPGADVQAPPQDLSASFVQAVVHPPQELQQDVGAAPSVPPVEEDEEFILQSDEMELTPEPLAVSESQGPDVIFIEEDDKAPLIEEPVSFEEPSPEPSSASKTAQEAPFEAGLEGPAVSQDLSHERFEQAAEELAEEPMPQEPRRTEPPEPVAPMPSASAGPSKTIPRQAEYSLPPDLPPGVDEKIVRMWLRALTNKSKVVRKQAAKELKKLTGHTYEWE
ncbi:MAG: hypothetical protein Kow0059_10450 [Candidatus Sumerlaeia bacterium]